MTGVVEDFPLDHASLGQLRQELGRARDRWHKVVDLVQLHEGKLGTLEWRLTEMERHLTRIDGELEQLVTGVQLESLREMLDYRLKNLSDSLDLVNKGARWIIGTVLLAVVMALLSLVMRGAGT